MDILENRIDLMVAQTLKSPRSGRKKEIDKSIGLKKGQFQTNDPNKDWSRPKRNLSTNSYFNGLKQNKDLKPHNANFRNKGHYLNSSDALEESNKTEDKQNPDNIIQLNPPNTNNSDFASLRRSLKFQASSNTTGLRKNIYKGQEDRNYSSNNNGDLASSNNICSASVKDGFAFEDYQLQGRKLGEGAYAVVRPGLNLKSGSLYAIKTFNKLKLTNNNLKSSVLNEIEILS